MKLTLQYDPWAERAEAQRAADALGVLGIPVHLVEVRPGSKGATPSVAGPVAFEPVKKWCARCSESSPCRCQGNASFDPEAIEKVAKHLKDAGVAV